MAKTMMIFVAIPVALALVFFGWKLTSRSAYESAEYEIVEQDGPFEIREYPDLMLASTRMRTGSQGNDGSFMRLLLRKEFRNRRTRACKSGSEAAAGLRSFAFPVK